MANNLTVGISLLSQDIGNNTSTIRVTVVANFQYYASSQVGSTAYVNIDGAQQSFGVGGYNVGNGGSVHIGTFDRVISHSADGTRSVGASASWAPPYVYPSGITFSGSASTGLTTIPRASSFSISGSTLGSAMTISISRASSSFTHTVRYQFGNIQRDYTGQTTSCSFTPPLTDASQIPYANSGVGAITVFTYNGGTQIGSKSASFTLNLPASAVPSFSSLTVAQLTGWNGYYLQGYSQAKLTINSPSGIYGSSIQSYSISGSGYSSSAQTLSTGNLNTAGVITFTGTITDTRGRTASKTVSITVTSYALPSISLKAERCTSAMVASNTGTYIKVTPTFNFSAIGDKNGIKTRNFSIVGTSYTNTTALSGASFILGNNDVLVSKTYKVSGVITDNVGKTSATITVEIPTSVVPFNLRDNGKGVAFGKYSEKENTLESAWGIIAPSVTCTTLAPQNISCAAGNEIVFNSSNSSMWFGYQAGNNGIKVNSWYFGNGTKGGKGVIYCQTIDFAEAYSTNWFRSKGKTGWYSQDYGGGMFMEDSSFIKFSAGLHSQGKPCWIGMQYASGSEWLGFYSTPQGTRKGWIGHNGDSTFHFNNEAGTTFQFNKPGGLAEVIHGSVEIYAPQPYIDFHFANSGADYSTRIICHGYGAMGYYGSWNALSDRRKKKKIGTLSNKYLDLLTLLKPCKFIYDYNSIEFDKYTLGYIAQDVIDAIKEAGLENDSLNIVSYDEENDTYSLSYNDIEPIHTLAIQHLMKEVEVLKAENQQLMSRIENIEEFMKTQEVKEV